MNLILLLTATLLLVFISGCSNEVKNTNQETEQLSNLNMPNYSINDVFVYDDNHIERINNIQGEIIDWEASAGASHYKAYRNFILPMLEWETENKKGSIKIDINNYNFLWPLKIGNADSIELEEYVVDKASADNNQTFRLKWSCLVKKIETTTVAIGKFDTVPITCDLRFNSGGLIQSSIWYYAPKIQHYIKRIYKSSLSTGIVIQRERGLVAYIPVIAGASSAESQVAESHLQTSLEKLPSGSKTTWRNSKGNLSRDIIVLNSFITRDKRLCRNIEITIQDANAKSKQYLSVFCRDDTSWKVSFTQ